MPIMQVEKVRVRRSNILTSCIMELTLRVADTRVPAQNSKHTSVLRWFWEDVGLSERLNNPYTLEQRHSVSEMLGWGWN